MTAKFTNITFPISTLLGQIETGQIGLPELQRPFVWDRAQVRDLMDSLYRGYPTGHFLFWQANPDQGAVAIGTDQKQASPSLLVVDGQQRLTSLFAVFLGHPVLNDKFESVKIRIGFNPLKERFEVTNKAVEQDPEWVDDIAEVLANPGGSFAFINSYLQVLAGSREVTPEMQGRIAANLQRLADLPKYTFSAIQLSYDLPVEEVSEIFVRVNSKGTQLSQADFILTLMSVYWDKGRKELEDFCRAAKVSTGEASPFNWFFEPSPDQLLRVAIGLGHRRAQLRYAYELLRGKDLETKEVSAETRDHNFAILKKAQAEAIDLTNFTEFLKALPEAGFRSGQMITSRNTIVYSYLVFLLGRCDFGIDYKTLRSAIARWFTMCVLTSRYTGSAETQVEKDIRRLGEAKDAEGFLAILDGVISSQLTNDYWELSLPDQLSWSGANVPAMYAYFAALNVLGAKVLFSSLTVNELLDPAQAGKKKAIERHHLFPKAFLEAQGIKGTARTNQVANFALLEWPDNIKVGAKAPVDYFPALFAERVSPADEEKVRFLHALPPGWEEMEYEEFLQARRPLMAKVVKAGFEKLAHGTDPHPATAPPEAKPSLPALIELGESIDVEFKSSAFFSYKPDVPEKVITGAILKTVAAFLNTEGGTLGIGIADDGTVLGIDNDLAAKKFDLDKYENALHTLLITNLGMLPAHRCKVAFEQIDGTTVCRIDVAAGITPTFANTDKGKGIFYKRQGNTTQVLDTKDTVEYISERFGVS